MNTKFAARFWVAMFTIVIIVGIANNPAQASADISTTSDCNTPPAPAPEEYIIDIVK